MEAEEFFNLHRDKLGQPDAVKVFKDVKGWGVFLQIDGPFEKAEQARASAQIIKQDLTDVLTDAEESD